MGFHARERPGLADGEFWVERQMSDSEPVEIGHAAADAMEHPFDLVVASFGQDHLGEVRTENLQACGARMVSFGGEPESMGEGGDGSFRDDFGRLHVVCLFDPAMAAHEGF